MLPALRDHDAAEIGGALAETDIDQGRPEATEEAILAHLWYVAEDWHVTGWAEEACVRGYRTKRRALAETADARR
jgi:hypothetical protein